MRPDGTRTRPTSDRALCFLNLLNSFDNHIKKIPPDHGMEWLAPFGMNRFNEDFVPGDPNKLWRTPFFPSMQQCKKDVPRLPKQGKDDGWKCGFGLVATIAIIMRDIIGNDNEACHLFCQTF